MDGAGNAYVTGETDSTAATFPETVGPDLSINGSRDVFVAKISPFNPPPSPSGVVATATSSSRIRVTWDPVSGATSYEVYRSESPGGPYGAAHVETTNGYDSNGRAPSTTYYYVVRAVNVAGSSDDSVEVSATTLPTTPAPTNLAVTGATASQVSLSWQAVAGASSYQLRRSTAPGGPYSPVASTAATTMTDSTATPATTYRYVVVANGPGGPSASSAEVTARTLPVAPAGVTTSPVTATRVQVSWNAVAGATAYEVWHTTTTGGPYVKRATVSATSYLHTTAVPATTQYYVVRTVGPTGTSANSAQAGVTTPALPPPPTNVVATPVSSTRVAVSWSAVAGATSYEVHRATTSGGPYVKQKTQSVTTYTDTAASPATSYFYVVRTVNPNGISANSTQATATTP